MCYCSTYNTFFMDLPVSSFVSPSSLLTAKCVDQGDDLAVDSFLSQWISSLFFTVATLIVKLIFKCFSARSAG